MRPVPIGPGVEAFPARTPTLPPATHTNSYALGTRDVLLVEPATPFEDERRAWIAWARALAGAGRTPRAVLVTHHHPDHVGGAGFLARALGLPVWAHGETARRLEPGLVARTLEDGEAIVLDGPAPQRWDVLHTPGHAPGHLCLHDAAAGVLVCGDMVASVGTIVIDPVDGDMAEYLRQLARLKGLGARVALPAHGDPIDAPAALFDRYVAHRLMREAKVAGALEAAGDGGATLDALLPSAYADTPRALWMLARWSLEAHLVKLEREGRARRTERGWGRDGRRGTPDARDGG
ncbi:MAG TPA: MBL fold metallo-hydrolase [Candidatus Binatia bacterium]|nr:MBL fold metallo-hydrolase [Candidatus Binatia bacterium]